MKHTLYEFVGKDGKERWVLTGSALPPHSRYIRILEAAANEDMTLTNSDNRLLKQYEDAERIEREPTAEECGSYNELDFDYRKAVGNPVTVYDLVKADRLRLWFDINPEYDTTAYMLRVVQMAHDNNCYDSLMSALCRLCCRQDETIVMSSDTPIGSFFWRTITREELLIYDEDLRRCKESMLPSRKYYHGGLIGHRKWVNGEPTNVMDWSVHT